VTLHGLTSDGFALASAHHSRKTESERLGEPAMSRSLQRTGHGRTVAAAMCL